MALKLMIKKLREVNAKDGFGNLLAVHTESAMIRDTILEELDPKEVPIDVDITAPDAEDQFKDAALDDDEVSGLIDSIPESEIDDSAAEVGQLIDDNVHEDDSEYIGESMESVMALIEKYVPDCEEAGEADADTLF